MKRRILTFITVFGISCLVACGGETKEDVSTDNKQESVMGSVANESTEKPVVEATAEPTAEPSSEVVDVTTKSTEAPVVEATPEPTQEPVLYPGIDMESDLPGQQWLETFVGIIEEPKVVVFNDITGKKVIVEQEGEVAVNPDEDAMALFFPEGYSNGNVSQGIITNKNVQQSCTENYLIFYLDPEKMREVDETEAAFLVKHGEEEVILIVKIKIE